MDSNHLVTILVAVFSATGLWEVVRVLIERKLNKKD